MSEDHYYRLNNSTGTNSLENRRNNISNGYPENTQLPIGSDNLHLQILVLNLFLYAWTAMSVSGMRQMHS